MLEVAVLYGCDLSQVFTPIILRLYQPHSLCEKGATRAAAKAALYVFLLPPLREGRPQLYPGANILVAFLLTPLREEAATAFETRQRVLLCQNFYSRPYARGDLRRAVLRTLPLLISTRAPTRGATAFFHKTIS